jgi:hypothetical protein
LCTTLSTRPPLCPNPPRINHYSSLILFLYFTSMLSNFHYVLSPDFWCRIILKWMPRPINWTPFNLRLKLDIHKILWARLSNLFLRIIHCIGLKWTPSINGSGYQFQKKTLVSPILPNSYSARTTNSAKNILFLCLPWLIWMRKISLWN